MYVQCTFNVRSMHGQCTFNARSMHAHCALVQPLLDNSGAFTGNSLSVAHASMRASPWEENATPLGLEGAARASGRGGIALCAPFERTCAHDLTTPATRGSNPRRFLTSQNRALCSAGWTDSRWFARPGFLHKGVALLALFPKTLNRQGCMLPCVMQSDEHGCSGERITHCIEPCRDPHALGLCRLSLRVRVCPAFAARSCSR